MNSTYLIRQDIISYEQGVNKIAYGIDVVKQEKTVISIHDIFSEYEPMKKLIDLCNRLNLESVHLKDVIEDALIQ